MTTNLYLINDMNPLGLEATVKETQLLFNDVTYSHFPIMRDKTYLGCIAETDIRCFNIDKKLLDYQYSLEGFFVRDNANWLDILESFAQNNCNLMPVLDHDNNYLGYFELKDIMNLFNQTPFLSEPGHILIVEKGFMDYSFSEIAQIVESNSSRILGLFISSLENDVAQVTVKITNSDINTIVQTFRRYSYNIVSQHNEDIFLNNLKDRSKYLDKYLNI